MEPSIEIEKRIRETLMNDPLFQVILDTPNEQHFLSEPYLLELIEKKYYSTPEVAGWFEVTDAQLRYYIKPFEAYLFDGEVMNPTTAHLIRLDFKAILKLRMILLLKDEYRVKGLRQLLRINSDGHIIKQTPAKETLPGPVQHEQVAFLMKAFTQIMQTGLFQFEKVDGEPTLVLNETFFQQLKTLPFESSQLLEKIQEQTEQLAQKNEALEEKVQALHQSKGDVAIKIREKIIEQTLLKRLEQEAFEQFRTTKKWAFFGKLFRSAQMKKELAQFIADYLDTHFTEQLTNALNDYHGVDTKKPAP